MLKKQTGLEWAAPTFIIQKKNKNVRFLSDFREVNKCIMSTLYPISKINTILQEIEGFIYCVTQNKLKVLLGRIFSGHP